MQIREQGRQVQLIRSPYDSVKKRCVQRVVHTFKQRYNYASNDLSEYLSVDQLADLSDVEKKSLRDWIDSKAEKAAVDSRNYYLTTAADLIYNIKNAIAESDSVDSKKTDEIWGAIEALSKTMKKRGLAKPAKQSTVKSSVPPGQSALELS